MKLAISILENQLIRDKGNLEIQVILSKYYFSFAKLSILTQEEKYDFYQRGYIHAKNALSVNNNHRDANIWFAANSIYGLQTGKTINLERWTRADSIRSAIKRVLSKNPADSEALFLLARFYRTTPKYFSYRDLKKAKKYILTALQYKTDSLHFFLELGYINIELEDWKNALRYLNKVIGLKDEPERKPENNQERAEAKRLIELINKLLEEQKE